MGCDLLALNLVREWTFLQKPPPAPKKQLPDKINLALANEAPDPQKLLRRRSSLIVADMPVSPTQFRDELMKATHGKTAAAPTQQQTFEEPDANSLLDSFGF